MSECYLKVIDHTQQLMAMNVIPRLVLDDA